MKICLLTDTHFGARTNSIIHQEYFSKFYKELFFPYLKKNNISHIIHLGDVIDKRKQIDFKILENFMTDFIIPIHDNNLTLSVIVGNHDVYYKNTNVLNSPTGLIWPHNNIQIYSEIEAVMMDNVKILFVPWINEENEKNVFDCIKKTKATILIGHLELRDFAMYKGHTSDVGYDSKVFSNFSMVISGHYHHRSHKKNIYYLGCPFEITWSDYGDPKGFHIFDTETKKLQFIQNRFTIFEKIYYDDSINTVLDLVNVKNKYVKVIVVNKKDKNTFDTFIDKLQDQEPYSMTIIEDFSENIDIDEEVNLEQDTLTFLNSYIDNIKNPSSVKNEIKTIFQKIYVEAINE